MAGGCAQTRADLTAAARGGISSCEIVARPENGGVATCETARQELVDAVTKSSNGKGVDAE